jgi:hypothetical protein
MSASGKLKLSIRGADAEFNSYFLRESTVAVNFKVGAKAVSPAYLADSVELFFAEMEAANIVSTVALGRNAKALNPKQNGFSRTTTSTT